VQPFETYVEKYCCFHPKEQPFGAYLDFQKITLAGKAVHFLPSGYDYHAALIHRDLAKVIGTTVGNWEETNGETLTEMLNAKLEVFEEKSQRLLAELVGSMRAYIGWWKSPDGPKFELKQTIGEDGTPTKVYSIKKARKVLEGYGNLFGGYLLDGVVDAQRIEVKGTHPVGVSVFVRK
jgi:hypothetical protein